jgi:NRPS condensation-like uncharacterized protein
MLEAAVQSIQLRHTLLNVRLKEDESNNPWFTSEGVKEISIESISRSSSETWIEHLEKALMLPYAFDTEPAIRFILVEGRDYSELMILCHHIICDGMSLAYLARDLLGQLGDPRAQLETLPDPPAMDLDNVPPDVGISGLRKKIIGRMNQKWLDERVTFSQKDYEAINQAYWAAFDHKMILVEFSETQTTALVEKCRAEGVTVNSALTVAFSAAQRIVRTEQAYHPRLIVASDLRERLPHQPGEAMGMYAGGVELKFKYNQRRSFWENARRLHDQLQKKYVNKILFAEILDWLHLEASLFEAMHFKTLGGLVPEGSPQHEKLHAFSKKDDTAKNVLRRGKMDSMEEPQWGLAVTNLGRLDIPSVYGNLELERLIFQPGGGFPLVQVELVLGVVTAADKLSLIVEHAEQAVDPKTMSQIIEQAMIHLETEWIVNVNE